MSDHLNDAVTVLVTLDMPTLCRAARLGGLPITLDEHPLDDEKSTVELLRFFAKRGISKAIHAQFEREYPMHYPDDVEFSDWQTSGSATGAFFESLAGERKMVKRPLGPFHDASHHTSQRVKELEAQKEQTPIRDKDNADKRISPPRFAPHGERNRAPRGMSGIKRHLPSPDDQKAKDGFKLGGPGDLKREFQPIARGKDKERGHER